MIIQSKDMKTEKIVLNKKTNVKKYKCVNKIKIIMEKKFFF
jgi:hypothetical protein